MAGARRRRQAVDPGTHHRRDRPPVVVGTPATVAETINQFVQEDASDGFILVPHITPGGLDGFADTVVPLLQARGVFRADYSGTTLREHLGLALPAGEAPAGARIQRVAS